MAKDKSTVKQELSYAPVDMDSWVRRKTYFHFKDFDDPFFNLTSEIDVTGLVEKVRQGSASFFLRTLFYATQAANSLEEFRYRIQGEEVVLYDNLSAGSTILYPDHTFGFCYFDSYQAVEEFEKHGKMRMAEAIDSRSVDPQDDRMDLIHFSTIPWFSFSGIKHPRRLGTKDSIPKIVFGKFYKASGRYKLPLGIDVHHGLVDGYHLGVYLERLEGMMNA